MSFYRAGAWQGDMLRVTGSDLSWRAAASVYGMRNPGTATGRCCAAADCKPAWITVAGFNLMDSFEECYLSVSKNILSWPPGETMLCHSRENPR